MNKENTFLDRFSCINKILPSKAKTSRAIIKTKYNVDFSYCLETSIAAMKSKTGNIIPFTINQYKKIGKDFCISLNKLIEPRIFFSVLSTIRFSKNEKCSLYSKTKAKAKGLFLPYINNITNNTNNNIKYSMDGSSNVTRSNKQKKKINGTNNSSSNKINNYFHKLNGKVSNNSINSKGINSNNKNGAISNSASTKDNNKNQSFKYNNIMFF